MRPQQCRYAHPQPLITTAGVLQISRPLFDRQFQCRFENRLIAIAWLAHLEGGSGLSFFGAMERFFGGAALPGGTNVAHVFPDSGLYSTVLPGIEGMRIK